MKPKSLKLLLEGMKLQLDEGQTEGIIKLTTEPLALDWEIYDYTKRAAETEMKSCNSCYYAAHVDEGYSNYTVEGTTFWCLLSKHPDAPFDEWYGEDERMKFAEKCDSFYKGEGFNLDVDGDSIKEYRKDHDERVSLWESLETP